MKRRGFLGFLGGAAVAAPAMAQQAATELSGLALPNVMPLMRSDSDIENIASFSSDHRWEFEELSKLIGMTKEDHAREMKGREVTYLDPDIHSWRSISLSAKIQMQRERNYWRWYHRRKGWLQSVIDEVKV